MWTAHARPALALFLIPLLSGCGLLSARPDPQPIRLDVVTTPGALDLCTLSTWIVPAEINADQAAELAIAARDEGRECAERHRALVEDVMRHNEGIQ